MLLDERGVIRAELEPPRIGRLSEFSLTVKRHDAGSAATHVRLHQHRPLQALGRRDGVLGNGDDTRRWMPDPEL